MFHHPCAECWVLLAAGFAEEEEVKTSSLLIQ
jgi:hypothetical protein